MSVRISKGNEVGILWKFNLNLTSNSVCALDWNFCLPRNLYRKFGIGRSEDRLVNEGQVRIMSVLSQ